MKPWPNFVDDNFALQILLAHGGNASRPQIIQYLEDNYTRPPKHALNYLFSQYTQLSRAGFVTQKYDLHNTQNGRSFSINDEVKHLISKLPQIASVGK